MSRDFVEEVYTYPLRGESYYLNMLKITSGNFEAWNTYIFALKEKLVKASISDVGIDIFSLEHYNYPGTEIWVAYGSPEKLAQGKIPVFDLIEMFVSVKTSEDGPFTTHMGIQRAPVSYEPHKALSMDLHSFGAYVMHVRYPEKKYMVNKPTLLMGALLYNELCAKGFESHVHVGATNGRIKIDAPAFEPFACLKREDLEGDESKAKNIDRAKKSYEDCLKVKFVNRRYEELVWAKKYLKYMQIEGEEAKTNFRAIEIGYHREVDKKYFHLFDADGKVIFNPSVEEMNGKFAWFFKTPGMNVGPVGYDIDHYHLLMTFDIDKLAEIRTYDMHSLHHDVSTYDETSGLGVIGGAGSFE